MGALELRCTEDVPMLSAHERAATRARERHTERTLHRTKCAMVVFRATSVWHMPHVFCSVREHCSPYVA